ncbi:centrosomal protein CEP112, partial [Schistosoma bovis]
VLKSDKNNYSLESGDHSVNEKEDVDEDRNKKYVEEESSSCSTDDELENTNAKSTRKNASEILQRTQAIEAEFYERLIELRKENETEVAKIMNRKNAELIAVQKAAEMKQCELRQAIDKLENQLSDTVNNADQIKRSSEEKMNQLQSVMNKQFENLLKQSNEQREFLIQEHEKTLKDLQNKNESTFKELEINKSFVIELESKMELQLLRLYKTLESKYNMCLEDYNQELKQIRSDHAKRICAMELERTNNEKQYETNLGKIKDEFNTKLEESRLSYERQLVTEVKEAETRGYEKCLLIKSDEITALQKTIKETKELNSNDEVNCQLKCEITKLNKIIEKLKNIYELKENNFLTIITKLQKKQLDDTLNKTNSIQTYFTNEKLLNSIIQWKKQQLNEIILLIKQKEFNQLEIIFKEKENIIHIVKLETELKEARRIAMTEVELRREQLSEISLARELERKELISKHENHLNEEQCKNQETILRLQEQHAEELKTISSQANEKLLGIEKEYKTRLTEANKRLNESQEKIINLDMILQKALQEKRNTQETLSESFQSEIEQMKNKQKQEVLILKEAISKERNRARLAEISLRQQEKAWNDMKTRWHEERIAQLGNSLPIESRTHMEATIEALRLQVNLLKKRITVMEEDRETNITYPLKLQFSDQDVSLLSEDSVQNESPVKDQPEANQDNLEKCKVNNNSVPLGDNSRRRIAAEYTNLQTNLDVYPYEATCSEDWLLSGH